MSDLVSTPSFFLRNVWYFALPSARLKTGAMATKLLLGEPVLFGRTDNGKAFAIRDVCPHRGMPLSYGAFDGKEVECCYHGWRFDCTGRCTQIPALTGSENIDAEKIRVRAYEVREAQGCVWVYMADEKGLNPTDEPPRLPDCPDGGLPIMTEVMNFPCFMDHAVVGLMDPAHGPFVHTSWWWRSRASIHEKAKKFGPSRLGFTMLRHRPSKNSFAYKLLGGAPETEISFQLPGVRIEHIQVGARYVINLTTVTPLDAGSTEITHSIYSNIGWAPFLKPLLHVFARRFLGQDRDVVVKQQDGLKHEANLLLIRDADTQARWYYQLTNEFTRAAAEGRTFVNPVKDTILKWRS